MSESITIESITRAAERIQGLAYRTPTYGSFSEKNVWFKLESFQPVRSFKIRGAANKILSLPEKERKQRGLITASSGNHGLAVAYVASKLGIKATIVLPEDVNPDKLAIIRSLGAKAVFAGVQQDERAQKANEIQESEGQFFIQPFNDIETICGQATCGLEILEDLPEVESIYVPIGGGGLVSGISASVKLSGAKARVIGVQPAGSASMYNSWKAGKLSRLEESKTIADGLKVRKPGEINFSFVKKYVDEIVLVNDPEILHATAKLLKEEHLLAEPSGAASFAGLLKSRKKESEKSVAVISGGNISSSVLSQIVSGLK